PVLGRDRLVGRYPVLHRCWDLLGRRRLRRGAERVRGWLECGRRRLEHWRRGRLVSRRFVGRRLGSVSLVHRGLGGRRRGRPRYRLDHRVADESREGCERGVVIQVKHRGNGVHIAIAVHREHDTPAFRRQRDRTLIDSALGETEGHVIAWDERADLFHALALGLALFFRLLAGGLGLFLRLLDGGQPLFLCLPEGFVTRLLRLIGLAQELIELSFEIRRRRVIPRRELELRSLESEYRIQREQRLLLAEYRRHNTAIGDA